MQIRRPLARCSVEVDLEVVIVSHRDGKWLEPCLESLATAAGACAYRTTIVENGGARISLAEARDRRVLYVENRGFGAANNAGALGSPADLLLFLNPDTELVDGTLERLVQAMRDRPRVGLVAVRQVAGDGTLWPSLHRFPSVGRAMAAALASEKWPVLGERLGERVLDVGAYERTGTFDWTTGAVLAVRREAFEARVRRALPLLGGDRSVQAHTGPGLGAHVEPGVTFVHHAGKAGVHPAREAQMAHARMQYARKHARPCPRRVVSSGPADAPRDAAGRPAAAREHADVERARSSSGAARVARHRKRRRTGGATASRPGGSDGRRHGAPVSPGRRTALIGHFVEGTHWNGAGSSRPISTSFASTRQAPRRAS